MKYKAVLFDFGGVIELNAGKGMLEAIAGLLHVPPEDFKKAYFDHNHLSNVHNMKWKDMMKEVVRVFDKSKAAEKRVMELVEERESKKTMNVELLKLFPTLRREGYKVAILSNNTSDLRKFLEEKGIDKLVDEIIVSAEIGFQKPHKEAFDVAFKKLGIQAEEAVFVDDSTKSLEKAAEIGYYPILFENNEELKLALKSIGIATQ
jgi:putative hydrolase of the HAD superfamily